MKELDRKRIEHNLQRIEEWRASGQTLQSFAKQHGQTSEHWRGKLSWERRWRKLLKDKPVSTKMPDSATACQFVKATPALDGVVAGKPPATHLRITLVGAAGAGLQAQIDWPLGELQHSSQWLREVLA